MSEQRDLRADLERFRADAELGRLVRRMPPGTSVYRDPDEHSWGVEYIHKSGRRRVKAYGYDTPKAALRAALGEESE